MSVFFFFCTLFLSSHLINFPFHFVFGNLEVFSVIFVNLFFPLDIAVCIWESGWREKFGQGSHVSDANEFRATSLSCGLTEILLVDLRVLPLNWIFLFFLSLSLSLTTLTYSHSSCWRKCPFLSRSAFTFPVLSQDFVLLENWNWCIFQFQIYILKDNSNYFAYPNIFN